MFTPLLFSLRVATSCYMRFRAYAADAAADCHAAFR